MGHLYHQRVGILGGGQLGKMLCQAGSRLGINLSVLEGEADCPASLVVPAVETGNLNDNDAVLAFGRTKDIVTIEIENVSVEALEQLASEGIRVFPAPAAMRIIRDKGLQKEFYLKNGFPTSSFQLFESASAVRMAVSEGTLQLPFVQKSRRDGYDGKGVQIIRTFESLHELLEGPCLVEDLVDVSKEIAVIVARDEHGKTVTFPVVEMQFHPTANLVEFLFCPSDLDQAKQDEACQLACRLADELDIVGLLAVELFVDQKGAILINEVAPRPHNSGHHTIEACDISQYEMHLRAILGLPLITPQLRCPAVMINVLGEPGYSGKAEYRGLAECLSMPGVYPHIYGKKMTKPFRKMGHVTVLGDTLEHAVEKARFVQSTLKVVS